MGRRIAALLVMAGMCLLTGCAVGRFIVGAPSGSARDRPNALLVRRCGGCHDVPEPSTMSAESWQKALRRMKKRITLPEAEWGSLAAMPTAGS